MRWCITSSTKNLQYSIRPNEISDHEYCFDSCDIRLKLCTGNSTSFKKTQRDSMTHVLLQCAITREIVRRALFTCFRRSFFWCQCNFFSYFESNVDIIFYYIEYYNVASVIWLNCLRCIRKQRGVYIII